MGKVRRVMITGASGFIGRATVAHALSQGLEVVAVIRKTVPEEWRGDMRITVLRCDLSDPANTDSLAESMDVDAVIHAAAHLGSDAASMERDSVKATETLLHALTISGIKRLVLVSSLAVYDTTTVRSRGNVTEQTPLEHADTARDGYVRGKLLQEDLCLRAAERRGLSLCILRPGAVFGPGRTWNAHIGPGLGPIVIRIGARQGEVPVCHINTCAAALVAAARSGFDGTLNVLDDDRPSRQRFLRVHRLSGWPRLTLPFHWRILQMLGLFAGLLPGRTPGLLRSDVLRARMMPLNYPNDALRRAFDLPDSGRFDDLMADALTRAVV